MLSPADIKYGILKTRDLVELYFGARMVANSKTTRYPASATPYLILGADPRRISYEIFWNGIAFTAATSIYLGTPAQIDDGSAPDITSQIISSVGIRRDFFTELDSVVQPQMISDASGTMLFSVREIYLTPIPIDETP
jgi:hypothetical protein